jgi:hypothetical protein
MSLSFTSRMPLMSKNRLSVGSMVTAPAPQSTALSWNLDCSDANGRLVPPGRISWPAMVLWFGILTIEMPWQVTSEESVGDGFCKAAMNAL